MPAKSTSKDDLTELKSVIEAALMASDVPLSVRKIRNMFDEAERPETTQVNKALAAIEKDCDSRGIELRQIGKGYRFQTKDQYAGWLRKLRDTRPPRYSRALIETLSIIAYRQPVTRGDIEGIRGVAVSSDIMRTLLDREWITQIGHRDVPGRPALYATSDSFLEYFNLRSLSDLPALMEPRDVTDVAKDLNITLPMTLPDLKTDEDIFGDDDDDDGDESRDDISDDSTDEDVSAVAAENEHENNDLSLNPDVSSTTESVYADEDDDDDDDDDEDYDEEDDDDDDDDTGYVDANVVPLESALTASDSTAVVSTDVDDDDDDDDDESEDEDEPEVVEQSVDTLDADIADTSSASHSLKVVADNTDSRTEAVVDFSDLDALPAEDTESGEDEAGLPETPASPSQDLQELQDPPAAEALSENPDDDADEVHGQIPQIQVIDTSRAVDHELEASESSEPRTSDTATMEKDESDANQADDDSSSDHDSSEKPV